MTSERIEVITSNTVAEKKSEATGYTINITNQNPNLEYFLQIQFTKIC